MTPLDLARYPEVVCLNTRLFPSDSWDCHCLMTLGRADVFFNPDWPNTFYHEMGHACAYLLGIETALGELVKRQPGAKSPTNENPFCYGAQRLAVHQYQTALAEYAAVAIALYVSDRAQLPPEVTAFLDKVW